MATLDLPDRYLKRHAHDLAPRVRDILERLPPDVFRLVEAAYCSALPAPGVPTEAWFVAERKRVRELAPPLQLLSDEELDTALFVVIADDGEHTSR